MKLTHGSLFSGIGGFELGAKWSGIETVWNCELFEFNRNVLKKHFPNTIQYEDIREMRSPESVDVISGGFPCQDISISGKGKGIKGEKSGLWNEMRRVIQEVNPNFVIIENSPQLTRKGLEKVLFDLSEIGHDAEWQCISNASFGFSHTRERIYIISYSNKIRSKGSYESSIFQKIFQKRGESSKEIDLSLPMQRIDFNGEFDTSRINDGFSEGLDKLRPSFEAYGNAVNPYVAHYLFECIKSYIELN